MKRATWTVGLGLAIAALAAPAQAVTCDQLAKLALPQGTITSAQMVAAGAFVPPPSRPRPRSTNPYADPPPPPYDYKSVPAFCRVKATLTPSSDSGIRVEVWMPVSGWNGRFQGVGNGGWAGTISYTALADAVKAGYAGASTDTGHTGNNAAFAVGHPEKLIDMGYRAIHEMTVKGKSIVSSFYGSAPSLSMFNGCSLGGRQAVTEADRYPADYDAIIAGAPALYNMHLHTARIALNAAVQRSPGSRIPLSKYMMIHQAVLRACDGLDGVKDGVIDDPMRCHFDPQVLQCKGADSPSCLTSQQVETARIMYGPWKTPEGQWLSEPLLQPGSELSWSILAGTEPVGTALNGLRYVVFKDPKWSPKTFNPNTDIDRALAADDGTLELTDPNLGPYFTRGGKLLLYHGWQDPQVAAQNTVHFFKDVVKTMGPAVVDKSIQLYMVPGMNHCRGGPGPDVFDKVAAMESWIKTGKAPADIIASHKNRDGVVDRTRPLCPYGEVEHWKGPGSTNDAANFSCVAEAGAGR
jgi:Tannase and feruloyl esterase